MSVIILDAAGHEVERRAVTPRRVLLSRAAIDRLADLVGVTSPAGQMLTSTGSLDGLGRRLGAPGAEPGPAPSGVDAPETEESDLDELLAAAGLVDVGTPSEEGRAVLTVWDTPSLAVELEMLVSLRRGRARVRSWHRTLDDWVVCVSTGDGLTFELSWLSADDWWLELGRAACVDPAALSAVDADDPLPAIIETSWDLLLATGEAAQRGRFDLLDQMASDCSGMTASGESPASLEPADDPDVRRWLQQLESTSRGRLHAAVMGRSERGRPGVGIVEWVLFHDGWRALTPFVRDGWTMVRIERTSPADLPRELAVRAAAVTS